MESGGYQERFAATRSSAAQTQQNMKQGQIAPSSPICIRPEINLVAMNVVCGGAMDPTGASQLHLFPFRGVKHGQTDSVHWQASAISL